MGEPNQVRVLVSQYERPSFWMNEAQTSLRTALLGRGNRPDICLRNAVKELTEAYKVGQSIDSLSPLPPNLPEEADLREIWLAVAGALETAAIERIHQLEAAAAITEAVEVFETA